MPPLPFGAVAGTVLVLAIPGAAQLGHVRAPESGPVEVVASRTGFRPRVLNVRKGEVVRLTLRTADQEHCFALDAFRVEKRLRPGRPISLEITPDRAGTFPFQCCLETGSAADTEKGQLVVTE